MLYLSLILSILSIVSITIFYYLNSKALEVINECFETIANSLMLRTKFSIQIIEQIKMLKEKQKEDKP